MWACKVEKLKRSEPTCEGAERFSWGVFSDSVRDQRLCMRSGKMWMGRSAEIEVPVGAAAYTGCALTS